ncbi:Fc.00g092570.m01.CDS01 [Cosmosporella sp. VM-42]
MPTIKAHLVSWFVWLQFKRNWQTAEALNKKIEHNRKTADYRPPQKLSKSFNIEETDKWGFPVYHVSPKSEKPIEARILYNHGGGFVFEITPEHWALVGVLAERLHAVVTVPIYPLGPETPVVKMYDTVQPLYNELAAAKETTPFWVMGDSAGGSMTFVLTQQALKAGVPAASRMVPITPCMDSSLANPDAHVVAQRDPWLAVPGINEVTRLICPNESPQDPRVSPIYGDFSSLPPMLIFGASEDLLMPDAKKAAEKAKEHGREAEFVYGQGMVHVWPLLPTWEAGQAVDRIVEWLEVAKK